MPEWSNGAVSKTVERYAFQGFESLSLRLIMLSEVIALFFLILSKNIKHQTPN